MSPEERKAKADELRRQADELEQPDPYDIVDQWLSQLVISGRGRDRTPEERRRRDLVTKRGYKNVVISYLRWLDQETTPSV